MSTAKRLVLSLRGRNESQNGNGESSTRLYSSSSPGHELDEIAVVSCGATDSARVSYGSLSLGAVVQPANGPRYVPGRCYVEQQKTCISYFFYCEFYDVRFFVFFCKNIKLFSSLILFMYEKNLSLQHYDMSSYILYIIIFS